MPTDIRLPKLGEGADSGTVVAVHVKAGDTVRQDQTLLELENEKAVAAIPSTASGTVAKVHVKAGDKVSVGALLVTLDGGGAPAGAVPSQQSTPAATAARGGAGAPARTEEPEPAGAAVSGHLPPAASPTIRKMARELGIDLATVRGTGPGGRIEPEDLRRYVARLQGAAPPAKPPAARTDFATWGPVTRQPFSALRQTVARRMTESWTTIPHVTQFDEADITDLLALKQQFDAAYAQRGAKLTLTALLLKPLVATLKAHPKFNVSLDEAAQEVVVKAYYHIGIAVDTDAGLLVPVLRDVDKKSVLQLAKELDALAEKTRQRKVTAEEMQGSTFTVSNQGGLGGGHFTPIIKHPDVAILGIGRGTLKPVVRDTQVVPRTLLPLALSYDHRVVDGADAARFIRDLVQAIHQASATDLKL